MQFCLIDPDADYRKVLRYHLEVEWPDAKVVEFDQLTDTDPSVEALSECDAILAACPLRGRDRLAGVQRLLKTDFLPPVVLFAEDGDELLAVDALKSGAASYFPKDRVTYLRLIETLRTEIGARGNALAAPLVGTHGQYRFIEELHSTSITTVYLAEPTDDTGTRLAIKMVRYVPDTGSDRLFDRFLQEYEIIAGINHPNVVKIFDLGVADDHAFIAMEYVASGRLSDRLDGVIAPAVAVEHLAQIASALAAVHKAGILHRDLKPANIMFRNDDSIALIDFGLAKWMTLEAALTGEGQIFGTPHYMSPEQGHAEPIDERADLYSLGCVFYEMLTGQRPFSSSSAMGVIYKHANARRPELEPELAAFQPLLDRLMAIDPADRFQSADELLAAIDARTDPAGRSIRRGG